MNIFEEIEKQFYDHVKRYGVEPKSLLLGENTLRELAVLARGCCFMAIETSDELSKLNHGETESNLEFMGMKVELHEDMKPNTFYIS